MRSKYIITGTKLYDIKVSYLKKSLNNDSVNNNSFYTNIKEEIKNRPLLVGKGPILSEDLMSPNEEFSDPLYSLIPIENIHELNLQTITYEVDSVIIIDFHGFISSFESYINFFPF